MVTQGTTCQRTASSPASFSKQMLSSLYTRQALLQQTSTLDCVLNPLQKRDSQHLLRFQSLLEEGTEQLANPVHKGKVPPGIDPEPVSLVILWAFQLRKGHWTPPLASRSAFYLGFSSRRKGAKTSYKLFLEREEKRTSQVLRNEKGSES